MSRRRTRRAFRLLTFTPKPKPTPEAGLDVDWRRLAAQAPGYYRMLASMANLKLARLAKGRDMTDAEKDQIINSRMGWK